MGFNTSKGARVGDYAQQQATYAGFVRGCIIVSALSALLLISLAIAFV